MPYVVALLRAATQSRPCKKPALSYTRRRGLSNEDWGRSNESRSQKPEVRRRNTKKKPGARSQKPEEKGTGVGGLCLCSFRIPQSQLLIHHSSFIIHNGGTSPGAPIYDTKQPGKELTRLLLFIQLLLIPGHLAPC